MRRSCVVWLISLLSTVAQAQGSSVEWCSLYGDFGYGSTGGSAVTSVLGDVAAGTMIASNAQVVAGFLANRQTWGSVTAIGDGGAAIPLAAELMQNFPNPFNPGTTITFQLPQASVVRLSLYDLLGREVAVLVNEKRSAGVHAVDLDASNLASGVYFYRMVARALVPGAGGTDDFIRTRRLLLLK